MNFSFFGLSRPARGVCDTLIEFIRNYRIQNSGLQSPIQPGGVYVPNLATCANFASVRSMAVYMDGQELIKKSDIVFVFVADHTLKAFARSMRRHNISGKIFCHFNPAYDADILDFDSGNTYVSFLAPVMKKNGNPDFSKGLIMEGYGERLNELSDALETIGLNVNVLTSDEKCIYQSAVNMFLRITHHCQTISAKLVKSVLGSDSEITQLFKQLYHQSDFELTCYNPIEHGDEEYIDNQRNLVKTLGLGDAGLLYATLLLMESTPDNTQLSPMLKEIAKNIIKKY